MTIDYPDRFGELGSETWVAILIERLREPMRYRSTRMDIMAWLEDDCFRIVSDFLIPFLCNFMYVLLNFYFYSPVNRQDHHGRHQN